MEMLKDEKSYFHLRDGERDAPPNPCFLTAWSCSTADSSISRNLARVCLLHDILVNWEHLQTSEKLSRQVSSIRRRIKAEIRENATEAALKATSVWEKTPLLHEMRWRLP
jgi:hypothetical protein